MQDPAFRTDLAMEAREAAGEIPGVEMTKEQAAGAEIVRVRVRTKEGADALGKPLGTYVTLTHPGLCIGEVRADGALAARLAQEIAALLPLREGAGVLLVGLGNRRLTPDSLGPRAAGAALVTRHLHKALPQLRPVSAILPGVTGETGLETGELVAAVCRAFHPGAVLALDALAARSAERLLTTVQIADAGVAPGSGVGNHRAALTREELGVPVVALGIPTVIHASTILRDALEHIAGEAGARVDARGLAEDLGAGDLLVTPAGIDEQVRAASALLADAIDLALHAPLTLADIRAIRGE